MLSTLCIAKKTDKQITGVSNGCCQYHPSSLASCCLRRELCAWTGTISHGRVKSRRKKCFQRRHRPRFSESKKHKGYSRQKSLCPTTRSHSEPLTATGGKDEKPEKKPDIFVPEQAPEHPRQIPPDELDDVSEHVPEGESKRPLSTLNYRRIKKHSRTMRRIISMTATTKTKICLYGNPIGSGDQFRSIRRCLPPNGCTIQLLLNKQRRKPDGYSFTLKDTDMLGAMVSGKSRKGREGIIPY